MNPDPVIKIISLCANKINNESSTALSKYTMLLYLKRTFERELDWIDSNIHEYETDATKILLGVKNDKSGAD